MMPHEELKAKALSDPKVRAEYERRIERGEMPMLDAILKARHEAHLTQADVAARMGTQASAVARLENALITGGKPVALARHAQKERGRPGQTPGNQTRINRGAVANLRREKRRMIASPDGAPLVQVRLLSENALPPRSRKAKRRNKPLSRAEEGASGSLTAVGPGNQ
jgi:transcriptional regulator with XRE-family HTH domain